MIQPDMNSRQPLIAIAGGIAPKHPSEGWPRQDTLVVPSSIVRALHRAHGQEAVLQPRLLEENPAAELLEYFDGLMLIGGPDVDPKLYGEQPHPRVYGVDDQRDLFEIALIHAALARKMPMLAICRGVQVLNVALGGRLDQHITGREGLLEHGIPGTGGGSLNTVHLIAGSRVLQAMQADAVTASCHHHQALAEVGDGLVVTGRTADGVIEAVEHREGWIVGVQWHPEDNAAQDAAQQGLFDALVSRASTLTPASHRRQ